ncbi:hypothetical protein AB0442_20170 [Kitasatospora sp. NPDC085895]|uniref:hypothetical protein n=1 Tax=Kitasatospora sp. NPDC085895 TaxID=3155057 RepID=UPI0034501E3F
MDYCAPCRRHLNGALSCPGCGAAGGPAPVDVTAVLPARSTARPARDGEPHRRRSRRTAAPKRRRAAILTAAGLVLGGAGVLALVAPDGSGAARPISAPVDDTVPAASDTPTVAPATTSAAPTRQVPAKPSKSASARPGASASASAPTATATPTTATPTATATVRPSHKPSPKPSKSCTPFLFWCT